MRVVIIGAGIGGLACAVGFARDGWKVRVLERWDDVPLVGTGLGLWPAAQQGLAALGLSEFVAREAVEFGDVAIFRPDGRVIAPVPRDRVERRLGIPVRILPRSTLLAALLERLRQLGVAVETGVDIDPAGVDADLVVGADGLRSTVRAAAFSGLGGLRYAGVVALRGEAAGEHGPYGETWGPGLYVGITRVRPGFTNWYAALPAPATARPDLSELIGRVGRWHTPIPEVLTATAPESVLRHPIHDLHPALPTFVRGRVALVGDAAHAMTPNLGRGACEALLDATVLVERLRGTTVAAGLAAYDRARRPAAQRIAARSWQLSRVAGATRLAGLRDGVLSAVSPLLTGRRTPPTPVGDAAAPM